VIPLHEWHRNIDPFIDSLIKAPTAHTNDFVVGRHRIEFYRKLLARQHEFRIDEVDRRGGVSYETAILNRILSLHDPVLVLVGGIGCGKSTFVHHLLHRLATEFTAATVRRPLLVDLIDLKAEADSAFAIRTAIVGMRDVAIRSVVNDWLRPVESAWDGERRKEIVDMLARLVLVRDVRHLSGTGGRRLPPTDNTTVSSLPRLLRLKPTPPEVEALVARIEEVEEDIDAWTDRVENAPDACDNAAIAALRLYVQAIAAANPRTLVVIDNVDQLPTQTISEVMRALQPVAACIPDLCLLVPLRPSSILPQGFIQHVYSMYHYGPSCFEMLLLRISKHVLACSRENLAVAIEEARKKSESASIGIGGHHFIGKPTEPELNAFLVASHFYARILAAGLNIEKESARAAELLASHKSHQFLARIDVSDHSLKALASILSAVVGHSGRYATGHLSSYYKYIYLTADLLIRTSQAVSSNDGATFLVDYKQLVGLLLLDEHGSLDPKIANLFSAPMRGAHGQIPSLTKLRILEALHSRGGRMSVGEVLGLLTQYGIPVEVGVRALNYLSEKTRLLLWLSHNRSLDPIAPALDHYVVISEHGARYWESLVAEFDYLWACQAQILGRSLRDESYVTKLTEYLELVRGLVYTERKQLSLRYACSGFLDGMSAKGVGRERVALHVLLRSLPSALATALAIVQSAEINRRNDPTREGYFERLEAAVISLCEFLLTLRGTYRLTPNHIPIAERYEAEVRESVSRLSELSEIDGIGATCRESIALARTELLAWLTEADSGHAEERVTPAPDAAAGHRLGMATLSLVDPSQDLVRDVSRANGLMEELRRDLSPNSVRPTIVTIAYERYQRRCSDLRRRLDGAMTPGEAEMRRVLDDELERCEKVLATLRDAQFELVGCIMLSQMDSVKERYNACLASCDGVTDWLDLPRVDVANLRWA
jgi:hypothetical protein